MCIRDSIYAVLTEINIIYSTFKECITMNVHYVKTITFQFNAIGNRLKATQFISSLNIFLHEQFCKEINMSIYK